MTSRDKILGAARRLTIAQGAVPSLDVIAAEAGVSKGGLMHHFRTRTELVRGLARMSMLDARRDVAEAAGHGQAIEQYLRISSPDGDELNLFRAMVPVYPFLEDEPDDVPNAAREAAADWEELISRELGSEAAARLARLVGDGLLLNALIDGTHEDPAEIAQLVRALLSANATAGPSDEHPRADPSTGEPS